MLKPSLCYQCNYWKTSDSEIRVTPLGTKKVYGQIKSNANKIISLNTFSDVELQYLRSFLKNISGN